MITVGQPPTTAKIQEKNTTVWVLVPTQRTAVQRNITIWAKFRGVEQKAVLTLTP